MNFLDPSNVGELPRGSGAFGDVSIWLEEAIFGHRLWYRQTPWLIFLEFLGVADAFARKGSLFAPTTPEETTPYDLRYRQTLRNVLYNNDAIARIASQQRDDHYKWSAWTDEMLKAGAGPVGRLEELRERFARFDDFAKLVALVRQTTIEPGSNRRWTSRFVFPFGVGALFSDATLQMRRDYTVFGRAGEVLYLMLTRSSHADRLRTHFEGFLDPDQPKNRLVALLGSASDDVPDLAMKGEMFLPYRRHPTFERLALDWLAVLDIGLPDQDGFAHLVPLATLHVMLYQLETAAAVAGKARPSLVCEMIAPKRELVRQRSIASYYANDALSRQAIATYHQDHVVKRMPREHDPELEPDEALDDARDFLRRSFSYGPKEEHFGSVEDLLAKFEQTAESKLDANCGLVHSSYGRYIGLISRRGTNRNRYAPTDGLLKTLVIARVPKRVEFGKFLADMFEQYGLVFGPVEAKAALEEDSFDEATFERNKERLEARLSSMGMLKRLSDGCAYVLNPYSQATT